MKNSLVITGLAHLVFALSAQAFEAPSAEILKVRDPFRRPDVVATNLSALTPLERFPASDFQMIGVLTGPEKIRAMVLAPDGKSHFVAERMKIGQRNGVVRRITPDSILVRERIVNVFGQEESVDTELLLSAAKAK